MSKPQLKQRYPLTLDYREVDEYLRDKGLEPLETAFYSFWGDYLCDHNYGGYWCITDPNWTNDQRAKQIIETLFREFPECVEESCGNRRLNFYCPQGS